MRFYANECNQYRAGNGEMLLDVFYYHPNLFESWDLSFFFNLDKKVNLQHINDLA
jgi:hypothetical protein